MNYKVVLLPLAEKEANEAADYYEQQKEGLGIDFSTELENILRQLSEHPQYYSYTSAEKNLRSISLHRFPYQLIYEIREGKVVVFSVHHHRKKPLK